uniref:Uncharacterized protein n=1 Tax=Tanacetum cinerariifolium TaxID=118510 RepID=A0A6L2JIQ3_TANCI|nr:hypothetical protein [Tanacetum cinerariifolium]
MVQTMYGYKGSREPITVLKQHRRPLHAKESILLMANEDDQPTGQNDLATKVDKLTKQLESVIDGDTEGPYILKELDHGSHHLFKVEARIDIPTYGGTVDAEKLDSWIDQLKTYFTLYGVHSKEKVIFARLKLTSHALAWWNSMLKSLDEEVNRKGFAAALAVLVTKASQSRQHVLTHVLVGIIPVLIHLQSYLKTAISNYEVPLDEPVEEMGSEAIEEPAHKEEEFAQIVVLGLCVFFPNGEALSFVL